MSTLELKSEIKSELNQLLDSLEHEEELQGLYDTIRDFAEHRGLPKLGDTSPEYIAVLERALQQVKQGRTKTHEQVMKEIKQWRTK